MSKPRRISYHVAYRRTFHANPTPAFRRVPDWITVTMIGAVLGAVVGIVFSALYILLGI